MIKFVIQWFDLSYFKEGSFDNYPITTDELNTSEISADVLDALLISLKETAHICSLECLEKVSFPFLYYSI